MTESSIETRVFPRSGESRRLAIYALVGAFLVTLGMTPAFVAGNRELDIPEVIVVGISILVFWAAALTGAACTFSWRVRVDADGIGIRCLFSKWHFWPWEAFWDGRVQRISPFSYTFAENPRFFRRLDLQKLDGEGREFLHGVCRRLVPRPATPVPDLPDTLDFPSCLGRARLTANGLIICSPFRKKRFRWRDIEQLQIIRSVHDWPGFQRVELKFADGEQTLFAQHFTDVKSELASHYLETYVPAARTLVIALSEPPDSLAEAEVRIVNLQRQLQEQRKRRLVMGIWTLAFATLLHLCGGNVWLGLTVSLLFDLKIRLLMNVVQREIEKRMNEAEWWRESLAEKSLEVEGDRARSALAAVA